MSTQNVDMATCNGTLQPSGLLVVPWPATNLASTVSSNGASDEAQLAALYADLDIAKTTSGTTTTPELPVGDDSEM